MNSKNNQPYHIVTISPWPITTALGSLMLMTGMIVYIHQTNSYLYFMSMFLILLSTLQWWRDIIRESTFQGYHTLLVKKGLSWGMILFIISEIFFFISFFWTFFHLSLSPSPDIGSLWPPMGIIPFNPIHIPLLNTIILLASGFTITWAHHNILNNNLTQSLISLLVTILLGIYFSFLQMFEYSMAPFTIADSAYGSSFFVATGFHGLHVIIGTAFLVVSLLRHKILHYNKSHHFGFEAASWYWHFVDMVWLFLYISIYWWGK